MLKTAVIGLIKGYSYLISPLIGQNCRFHPTCSRYTALAIEKHGVLKGMVLGIRRISKCHPWHNGAYDDPIPDTIAWRDLIGYKRGTSKQKG